MDKISNLLISLKNAGAIGKEKINVPFSKFTLSILEVLKANEYIKAIHPTPESYKIEVVLNYDNKKNHKISDVKRISKLGRRVYYKVTDIKKIKHGYGNVILSTPQGIMTGREARAKQTGGEVLFEIS